MKVTILCYTHEKKSNKWSLNIKTVKINIGEIYLNLSYCKFIG